MTDPRTRKVIIVENPLLSTRVKEMIASILFDNLQVRASIPVARQAQAANSTPLPGSVNQLHVCTGTVLDGGWPHERTRRRRRAPRNYSHTRESVRRPEHHVQRKVTHRIRLQVYHSRPLFPYLTTTPVAGRRLNRRLRTLLLSYGCHAPPPPSLNSTEPARAGRPPREILDNDLIEEIKTRLCFVGDPIAPLSEAAESVALGPDESLNSGSDEADPDEALVKHLYKRYSQTAPTTKPVSFRVSSAATAASTTHSVGCGWFQVPGWIRERAAEVLWEEEEGDLDERGLAGVVLECLLRVRSLDPFPASSGETDTLDLTRTAPDRFAETDGVVYTRHGRDRDAPWVLYPLQTRASLAARAVPSSLAAAFATSAVLGGRRHVDFGGRDR